MMVSPAIAWAQDPEAAALFTAAKDLAAKGQWADACPKFEAAQRKEPALGTLMNLADCHEHTSMLFRSWGEWRLAFEQAKKAGDDPRADLSKRRFDALEPRLPRLKIVVSGMQSDLSVWRDEKQLDSAEYNTELPIDPGARTITVRRGADTLATQHKDMQEKAHETVSFDLDAIAKEHPAPIVTTPAGGGTKTGDGKVVQTNTVVVNGGGGEQKGPPAAKVAANIFLGVGLTAAVLGGAFLGVAAFIGNDTASCPRLGSRFVCTETNANNISTANILANVSQWALIGGGTFVATAIVLYIFAPKAEKPPNAQVGFAPTSGGAILSFARAF